MVLGYGELTGKIIGTFAMFGALAFIFFIEKKLTKKPKSEQQNKDVIHKDLKNCSHKMGKENLNKEEIIWTGKNLRMGQTNQKL